MLHDRRFFRLAVLGVLAAILMQFACGCLTMSQREIGAWNEIQELGLPPCKARRVSPALALFLNMVLGIGDFYLAASTRCPKMMVVGIANLLLTPYSVIWAPIQAVIDASTLNKVNTLIYYHTTPEGKALLEEARRARGRAPPLR